MACSSPLHIGNNSTFQSGFYKAESFTVPCGKCDACRNSLQNEWSSRLTSEVYYFYENGGCCVFLTFTYRNSRLPKVRIPQSDGSFKVVPCFSSNHIRKFLNLLHVKVWKKYGKDSYKYYLCSEYGKTTKRPHYHALFFLKKGVDPYWFSLRCQRLWRKNGWMFPKMDIRFPLSMSQCLLRCVGKCASYASKYATKDLSFYSLPHWDDYLKNFFSKLPEDSEEKSFIIDSLPHHWQSKGLGASFALNLSDSEKLDLICRGYLNPYTNEYEPISRYLQNKFLYFYDKEYFPRWSKKTEKPIYSRYCRKFFYDNYKVIYKNMVDRFAINVVEPLFSVRSNLFTCAHFSGINSATIVNLLNSIPQIFRSTLYTDLSNFHYVTKIMKYENVVMQLENCDISTLPWSTSFCADYWFQLKDNTSLIDVMVDDSEKFDISSYRYSSYYNILHELDDFVCQYQIYKCHHSSTAAVFRQNNMDTARVLKYRYPLAYC